MGYLSLDLTTQTYTVQKLMLHSEGEVKELRVPSSSTGYNEKKAFHFKRHFIPSKIRIVDNLIFSTEIFIREL